MKKKQGAEHSANTNLKQSKNDFLTSSLEHNVIDGKTNF